MKPLLLSLSLAVTAGAASAGGIAFSLPSLHFPPKDSLVTQGCTDIAPNATATCAETG